MKSFYISILRNCKLQKLPNESDKFNFHIVYARKDN